ncbi:MAG: acetyl-CoA carboxylase biotin carboxyl carrier protein [Phycisphaerae bacterium]|nr:acetyl-CoA carboxylase biotin carboxyl carrier protein [Phycisphaerae bacterium]
MNQQKKTANGGSARKPPTDIKQLKSLIDLMVENDLSRLELRDGDMHILLRRGQPVLSPPVPMVPAYPPVAAPLITNPNPALAEPPAAAADTENEVLIRSPMVGTFYISSGPEAPPFVNVGTPISPDTVVCIVEAMKVFNEIKAEVAGQITKVLVKNAEAVEFDQPLFAIAPA